MLLCIVNVDIGIRLQRGARPVPYGSVVELPESLGSELVKCGRVICEAEADEDQLARIHEYRKQREPGAASENETSKRKARR